MEMINLMPSNDRRQLTAARTNTLLLRYVILMGVFAALLVMELVAVYFIVSIGRANNEQTIRENETKTA